MREKGSGCASAGRLWSEGVLVRNRSRAIQRRISLDKQPGDQVFDGLLARLIRPLDDDLKALAVLEQAGVEFGLDGA